MKITNKKIIAALLIAATLTGCDSLNNKAKDNEDTKVEENTVDEKASEKEAEEDAEMTGSTEGEEVNKEVNKEANGEEEKESEAETDPGVTDREKLEDAIFNNRVQARAAEILLEEAPDSLSEETKAKLEQLIEDSTQLIEQAEALIDTL